MNFFTEYAPLFAASLPLVLIAGIQVFLFMGGERGTLLFPDLDDYPTPDGVGSRVARACESSPG